MKNMTMQERIELQAQADSLRRKSDRIKKMLKETNSDDLTEKETVELTAKADAYRKESDRIKKLLKEAEVRTVSEDVEDVGDGATNQDDSNEDETEGGETNQDDSNEDETEGGETNQDDSNEDETEGGETNQDDSNEDETDGGETNQDDSNEDETDGGETNQDDFEEDDSGKEVSKKKNWFWVALTISLIALLIALVAWLSQCNGPDLPPQGDDVPPPQSSTEQGNDDLVPPQDSTDDKVEDFDLNGFKVATNNLIDYYGGNTATKSNLILLVDKNGEDVLEKLCVTYGDINVQEHFAHLLVFAADAQMQKYIVDKNLQYNPNATPDYFDELARINQVYSDATGGKDASSVLKSIEGYSVVQGNREATISLIGENGELLKWYTAKCAADDILYRQLKDTEAADEYRENVQIEIVSSNGTFNLLRAQLEAADTFELGKASAEYNQFISDNYKFVIVGLN